MPNGAVTTLVDRFEGKKLNRPNDVICHSNGSLYFTDPGYRVPMAERELDAAVYRIAPDGAVSLAVPVEYPNGLALSPDERTLYIANTRWCQYIHAVELDAAGTMVRRRVFADMSADGTNGVPDGMKVDQAGRVFCTGTGGVWVFAPDGSEDRHHRNAGGVRQRRLRWTRPADAVPDCQHICLYAAGEDAGHAASMVQGARLAPCHCEERSDAAIPTQFGTKAEATLMEIAASALPPSQ